jgi:hypothetical protein
MSKASDAANAVLYAIEQVLNLYGVQYTREQSRVIMVEGAAGRFRPMYFGKWIDDDGNVHTSGKADILARPRIFAYYSETHNSEEFMTVPLWIEAKSGKGRLSPEQIAFKNWVESNGDHYLLIHDDARPLIAWLEENGVKRQPKRVIHAAEPLDTSSLQSLPCRHCAQKIEEHIGAAHGCPGKRGTVWSPALQTSRN